MNTDFLRGPVTGRLGFRLMAAFALALLPLAYLSYDQANQFERESQARWESALFGETLLAAGYQIDAISRTRGLASGLAETILPLINDSAQCSKTLEVLLRAESNFSHIAFVPTDGMMTCGSNGKTFDFSESAVFLSMQANPVPQMNVNLMGPVSGESILIFTHPVTTSNGVSVGYIVISMPHRLLESHANRPAPGYASSNIPVSLIAFDGDGTVLTAPNGLLAAADELPVRKQLTDFVNQPPTTFRDTIASGEDRTFAVMPIVVGQLYILGSWPATIAVNASFTGFFPAWIFPLSMWLCSMLVAFLAAEHQVLRHVRALRYSITAFAGGNRLMAPPDLSVAPNELRDVGDALERMMTSVLREAAVMEDSMRQKEVLLREVHHRVKNNLQLIASIMSLQIRKSQNPEARTLLKSLHERVMSLATVHRELYQTTGLTDIQADELLASIVSQVLRMATSADHKVETTTEFDPIRLSPDQAVPLSLILTEALTNALKHGSMAIPEKARLSVSLHQIGPDTARLEVSNPLSDGETPLPPNFDSSGLGRQLLTAFASQLLGKLTVGPDGDRYTMRLDFPMTALPPTDVEDDLTNVMQPKVA